MAGSLPANPSSAWLRSRARRIQEALRTADPTALTLLQEHHPRPEEVAAHSFPLHAAQLIVAREYGFRGWPALIDHLYHLDHVAAAGRPELEDEDDDSGTPADRFCRLACLRYDHLDSPQRWQRARELLAESPTLTTSIWAAAAAADPVATTAALADGASPDGEGGPRRMTPLMYLTYSRAGVGDALTTARLLLDAGADPDTGYLIGGLATPFTALTGAFGEGEMGPARQPEHPAGPALAHVLLAAGAEPNDAQTLYNRMFRRGTAHLDLLFGYGLGEGDGGPWRRRLGETTESVAAMMQRQVDWAISHLMVDRLTLLAAHGFGPGPAGVADRSRDVLSIPPNGPLRTPLHDAAFLGDLALIRDLLAAGADPHAVDGEYGTTPQAWAEVAEQWDAAEILAAAGTGE